MIELIKHLKTRRRETEDSPELGAITVAETLIALGIGTTVLATVFAGLPALMETRNSSDGLSGLAQIATSVRTTFGARNNYNGLTTQLATGLAGFPQNLVAEDGAIHPWDGQIRITGAGRSFTVLFEGLPAGACSSMVASSLQLADAVLVNTTTVNLEAEVGDGVPDPSDIGELCENETNSVAWTFSG